MEIRKNHPTPPCQSGNRQGENGMVYLGDAGFLFASKGIGSKGRFTSLHPPACLRTKSPSLEFGGITRSAMALCELCYKTLKEYGSAAKYACEHKLVTPALDAIIEANVYLSGVGADNGGLATAHSFYNGLTALGGHSVPHGNCVAFGTLVQLVLEGAPKEEFEEVQNFCLEVGLPITLEEIGITKEEEVRVIAEKACADGESIHNMAGDVTPDELYAAILAADTLGDARK